MCYHYYMKHTTQKSILLAIFVLSIVPALASAHQPRIVESRQTVVDSPEISKAYYGTLTDVPDVYTITAPNAFDLYVGVLVPDIAGQQKDVTATITKTGDQGVKGTEIAPLATLAGPPSTWKKFFEPFGHDTYWQGPEYRTRAEPDTYEIRVSSPQNDSKYSLAIGEIEVFDFKEGMNALKLVPQLKKDFFNESPIGFILSPMGWGFIVIMYLLAFVFGFLFRLIARKFAKSSTSKVAKNINTKDRLLRAIIGVILLLWAITTTWSPILIFLSGFCIFEAIFSWCGFYAAMGKNTCPVE